MSAPKRWNKRLKKWEPVPGYYEAMKVASGYTQKPSLVHQAIAAELGQSKHPKLIHRFGDCLILKTWRYSAQGWIYTGVWQGKTVHALNIRDVCIALRRTFPRKLITVTEIKAYRIWQLRGEFLHPVVQTNLTREGALAWEGPMQRADRLPTMTNKSGLYSVRTEEHLLQELRRSYVCEAFGVVGLLGQVVVCELGYRSEIQVVREIHMLVRSSLEYRAILAKRYQCEVHSADSDNDS